MVMAVVLMATPPVPLLLRLLNGVVAPTAPPKLVTPPVFSVSAFAPSRVLTKLIAPKLLLVKVTDDAVKVTAPV